MIKGYFMSEKIKVDVSVDGKLIGSVEISEGAQSRVYKEQAVFYKSGYMGGKYNYCFRLERRITDNEVEEANG
jgi:hypothetical protein